MPPGSDDKLAPYWPLEDESSYTSQAAAQMVLARQFEAYRGTTQVRQNYAASDMKGQAAEALARELGIKVAELGAASATHEMTAGWLTQGHADILAYKNTLSGAYTTYKSQMTAALTQGSIAGVIKINDQIESQLRQTCDSAKAGYEKARDIIAEGVKAGKTPPVKGPAPSTSRPGSRTGGQADIGVEQRAPDTVNSNLFDPSTGGYSTPAQGAGANTPGGGTSAGSAAGAGLAGDGSGQAFQPRFRGPDSAVSGPPAGAPTSGGSPMGGGMPMQGMQPPQMPQMPGGGQTPGGDIAKTGADMIGKLAGADKGAGSGVPVTPEQLDKLLDKQGGSGGLGGEKGEGSAAEGPDGKGDKKLNGTSTSTSGTTVNGPGGPNTGAAGGTHTGTGAPAGPPSPANPVTTHAPAAPSAAPMTELSADETPAGQQPQRGQDQTHHNNTATGTAQSTSASLAPFPGPPPSTAGQAAGGGIGPMALPPMGPMAPPPAAPALGAYSPGALGSVPAPVAPPAPMAPAMPTGALIGGASAPAAPLILPTRAGDGWSRTVEVTNYGVQDKDPEFVTRLNETDPDFTLSHAYLADITTSHLKIGWPTVAAIGVFMPPNFIEDREQFGKLARPLYVLATADGVSLLPDGVMMPIGLSLVTDFSVSDVFMDRWSGYEHPAAILAAFAASHFCPANHKLAYLVSSDNSGSKNGRYTTSVPEFVQIDAEREYLLQRGALGAFSSRPRSDLARISEFKAGDALEAFGDVWRLRDVTAADLPIARAELWAARWDAEDYRHPNYPALMAKYLYAEASAALRDDRLGDVAYSVSVLAALEPVQTLNATDSATGTRF